MLPYAHNDGGATIPDNGHCATRSIAIATGLAFGDVYRQLGKACATVERRTQSRKYYMAGKRRVWFNDDPRTGVSRKAMNLLLASLGWRWVAVHTSIDRLPMGRVIVRLAEHITCLIDGVEHSTYAFNELVTRRVYGYWIKE